MMKTKNKEELQVLAYKMYSCMCDVEVESDELLYEEMIEIMKNSGLDFFEDIATLKCLLFNLCYSAVKHNDELPEDEKVDLFKN